MKIMKLIININKIKNIINNNQKNKNKFTKKIFNKTKNQKITKFKF